MLQKLLQKTFGTKNEREIKAIRPIIDRINVFEPQMQAFSDDELRGQTARFRERLAQGEPLDDLMPEAFATVRETATRTLGQRHYDVQMIGGYGLHKGMVVEMKTGEGKTLVSTLPGYLNALTGKGVHIVTVNDYLAARDCEWMGKIYRFLDMTTGVITTTSGETGRRRAYAADITYGQNNELGFDYLRDNMKFALDDYVHRYLPTANDPKAKKIFHFAIVDEVDSILIDEARTPLIISGQPEASNERYLRANSVVPFLIKDLDYIVDEKGHSVALTESGVDKVEERLTLKNLYDTESMHWVHFIHTALKAHALYRRDVNYLIEENKVLIIDEHTGRKMAGRRWSDGLHQAVEAKEGVKIQHETRTVATVTFQNYFRMYEKLSGMTGTAETEAEEFAKIYDLDVLVIPTNRPIGRADHEDLIYKTERGKFHQVIADIEDAHQRGQPVLVGTISVEKSQFVADMLEQRGIPHDILNAKNHAREAEIVAQAGRLGSVTISTNMAGRGTDIVLGGNPELMARQEVFGTVNVHEDVDEDAPAYIEAAARYKLQCAAEKAEVLAAGGLGIFGTERHESRRIDNQLRGRAGRQGDPGTSQFYLSLEDDLMRVFGGDRVRKIMEWLNIPEDEPIVSKSVSKAIEGAQRRVEGQNFDARKNLLEYDDVMNLQRKTIYALRRQVLAAEDTGDLLREVISDGVYALIDRACSQDVQKSEWDIEGLEESLYVVTGVDIDLSEVERNFDRVEEAVVDVLTDEYDERRERSIDSILASMADAENPPERDEARKHWIEFERETYLRAIDGHWMDQLQTMDALRESVYLNAYAQKDPKLIYKKEGYDLFQVMIASIREKVVHTMFRVEVKTRAEIEQLQKEAEERRSKAIERMQAQHGGANALDGARAPAPGEGRPAYTGADGEAPNKVETLRRARPKVGRNDPCWCGSGKKYKKCHMADDDGSTYRPDGQAPA